MKLGKIQVPYRALNYHIQEANGAFMIDKFHVVDDKVYLSISSWGLFIYAEVEQRILKYD